MPVDKQVRIRYQVLNRCFRDLYKKYTIDDLVDACKCEDQQITHLAATLLRC